MAAPASWGPDPKKGLSFVAPGDREKEKGNGLFKEGKYAAALAAYSNGLEAVHYHYKKALDELTAEMKAMQNVRTHEFALCTYCPRTKSRSP